VRQEWYSHCARTLCGVLLLAAILWALYSTPDRSVGRGSLHTRKVRVKHHTSVVMKIDASERHWQPAIATGWRADTVDREIGSSQ
jgi:hypothetical protein